ncbi:hypothetical protein Glove_66g133 [Diversispora epigaea]|uniref:Protein kinase domain-containing protein n=1 Tax=Diversispora epigaea TaxID=1348612 RepID=A0A397JK84_9GLOM|nr:hypothetical protein Glove_66g133 [Diversispora epigaea]
MIRNAMNVNICMILNDLMGQDYNFSIEPTHSTGIPDFSCFYNVGSLEIKRKLVFILSTYDNHWFLCRNHNELLISNTLPLHSKSLSVLKVYAYLVRRAKSDFYSPNPNIIVSVHGNNNSHFKFKSILGIGRNGKTLPCKFRGDTNALKSADLSKTLPCVLEEMKKEVKIYKDLANVQGKYIPKLVCYGGGLSFVIGLTIVGTPLSHHYDIREENILVDNNWDIYLIDFGMANREDLNKKKETF